MGRIAEPLGAGAFDTMKIWTYLAIALLALPVLVVLAGQLGAFAGPAPSNLGVRDGRLKAPSRTPNSVSSQAHLWPGEAAQQARIEPLPAQGNAEATMTRLRTVVEATPGAKLIESRPDYLYAQFTTRWFGFVDDTEFWFDPAAQSVQVRSASRVGRRDFGVNRARIEAIRAALSR